MSKVKIQGNASGTGVLTITAPNTSTDRTITLPDGDVTLGAATPSIDDNGDATAITIDSSENVLIGKTTYVGGSGVTGIDIRPSGMINIAREGDTLMYMNRKNSDGDIVEFRKDGTTKGSIGVTSSGAYIKLGGTAAANALDDYEEGTFSPSFGGSDSQGFTVGSTQSAIGKYVKVGSVVHFHLSINITGSTPTSQGLRISGFPFTNNSATYAFFPIGAAYKPGNSTSLWNGSLWRMDKDGTTCRFYVIDTNATADGNQAWSGSNDEYRHEFSGSYLITI